MAKRRVVLTGAAGYISAQLLPVFRERYDLVLLDLTKETKEGRIDEIQEVDLSDPDVDPYREHFRGADATAALDMWITRRREFSHIPTAKQQQPIPHEIRW